MLTVRQHVSSLACLGFWFTCSQGVQEEKELSNSCADIERVEGFLQPV